VISTWLGIIVVCSRDAKLLVQLLAVGGLVNESEYRLLQYCNIELLFLIYFTKCVASTKHDAILDGIGKNISMYKHRTFTGVLLRTSTLHRYLHVALESCWRHSH